MEFTKFQKHLWNQMIAEIQEYLAGNTCDFDKLVGELEGIFDAGEFTDTRLIEQWYDFWTPLEIQRATRSDQTTPDQVETYLLAMKNFLEKTINAS